MTIERFRQLPKRFDDEWQGGLVRMPGWIERGPGGRLYRPWAGMWVSRTTGFVHFKLEPAPNSHDWALALDALVEFGLKKKLTGYRPGGLQVADKELGIRLLDAIGDGDITYTVLPDLPAVQQVLVDMTEYLGGPRPPNALDAGGVTVDRMVAFADAASRFYRAAPWRYLSGEDLIQVEAPAAGRGLKHVTVLGAGGQTFGLGFFESVGDFTETLDEPGPERFLARARWSLFYGPISHLPFGDADLWEQHGLPVAGEDAYPVAVHIGPDGRLSRPGADVLCYLEGLLRTLAETTEDEIDQGRWTRQLETYDGPATYRLCIPDLVQPLDAPPVVPRTGLPDRRAMERVMLEMERFMADAHFDDIEQANEAIRRRFSGPMNAIPTTASTPVEKAQELVYRAFESRGRRRTQLARKALELSGDCADAYVLLAEEAGDAAQALDLYERGVAAGERALGPRAFVENAGQFWGLITTRPYMRARFGMGQCLEDLGRSDEAIAHYRELLRLNPNDNQGVRYHLLTALLTSGLIDEAGALLKQFADEPTAMWLYGRALWIFRCEGDGPAARESLRRAKGANRHVPKYLTGKQSLPDDDPPSYALRSEDEAVICARALASVWRATPGAAEWLRAEPQTRVQKSRARHRR